MGIFLGLMAVAVSVARIVVAFDGINLAWRGWINMVISQDLADYFFFLLLSSGERDTITLRRAHEVERFWFGALQFHSHVCYTVVEDAIALDTCMNILYTSISPLTAACPGCVHVL